MPHSVFAPFTHHEAGLDVELVVQPAINYALTHNRVPLVRRIAVTNDTDTAPTGIGVRLELTGPDGPLAEVWERSVDGLRPGATVGWDDLSGFGPDPARLRGADEAFPVDYVLTVTRGGHPDVRLTAPSLVLAHNEWFNTPALYDTLAAFVQPNTDAVAAVLRTAANILLARTGSGALEGYQAGPERAARIAGAVYEAIRELGIHYQELPASFENTGQKIRTTAAVLAGRLGNCVDLSVTYAACLEQAGLRPLIWLTRGHAFGGFFLDEERLAATTVTETNLLISMVESGAVVPVELTRVGPGVHSAHFAAAVELGIAHFGGAGQDLMGVVDVHLAHRSGIRPLPSGDAPATEVAAATDAGAGGGARAIDLPPGVARTRLHELARAGDDAPPQPDDSPPRVRKWKKSLLDLSLRNPLLNLPRRGKGLDLHVPAGSLAELDNLVHAGKRIEIVPQDAISHIHELAGARRAQDLDAAILGRELSADRRIYGAVVEQRYRTAMRGLQRDARTLTQETGGNYLYLSLGTLVHPKGTGDEAHAPLFLLPVRIEGGSGQRRYTIAIDGAETASPNYCLVEWLRVKHRVQIPELERPILDDHGIDIPATLAAIRKSLVESNLNYRIDETASLRLLQFSTFQMWRDLTDHWSTFMRNPVVRHLVTNSGATFDDPAGDGSDPAVDERQLHLPIAADGSQMQAIVMAERGYSFVLEGPPGTGKSQTITNLIARAVAGGRTVLFVAEKQAALDVVKRRLAEVGLAPFVLDLHGRKQSINAVRQQLRQALEQADTGDDATWTAVETGYRTSLTPLDGYPARIHTTNAAGLSTWSAYESGLAYGAGPVAPVPLTYLTVADSLRTRVEQTLPLLPTVARSARLRPDHPWSLVGRRRVDGLSPAAVLQIAAELEDTRRELVARERLAAVVRELADPEEAAGFLPLAALAAGRGLPDRATTTRATDPAWDRAVASFHEAFTQWRAAYATELAAFRPETFASAALDTCRQAAEEAEHKLFGRSKARRRVADQLAPYLTAPGGGLDPDDVHRVTGRLVELRAHARTLSQQLRGIGGLRLPADWSPVTPEAPAQLDQAIQEMTACRSLLVTNPPLWALLTEDFTAADRDLLNRFVSGWRAWRGVLGSDPTSFACWAASAGGWYAAWQRDGSTWPTELHTDGLLPIQRWSAVLVHTDVLAESGLTAFRDGLLSGTTDPDTAELAYRRGLAATSLTERLRVGDLQYFDPGLHDDQIAGFESAAAQLRHALPEHLQSVLLRRRPFHPGERRGRVADFTSELRRKRGGRSFRELFTAYPDIVLAVTPCVLVSPASAANFLAPGAAEFDLVIFDEASQIRVAEAIGAMGRGRSVVIVGDSRQMPPTAMMQAGHGDEEPDSEAEQVPEDLDSILSEAVESGLPQRWLSWHYRSRDEALIAFSNRYYYDDRLSSLPSPGAGGDAGVLWHRVDGRFDRGGTRTNEVEARAVVAEITRRLRDPATGGESIGVVTFNVQQRDLILDLLEDSADPLIRERLSEEHPEPLFVKNLDNVQGDERDVILFSLAFSIDPDTGRLPLNFGPLSQTGGERRLNVAITRARRQVALYASFDPSDIDLTRTAAVGTRHLRAYCEMAASGVGRLGDVSANRHQRRDRIRDEVAAALRAAGYEVITGHGLSDFTVDIAVRAVGAPHWQVAVVLDGPQWSQRPTVADRDGAPALLRTIMGWPAVLRFWLPAWIREPTAFLKQVDEAIATAVARAAAPPPPSSVPDTPGPDVQGPAGTVDLDDVPAPVDDGPALGEPAAPALRGAVPAATPVAVSDIDATPVFVPFTPRRVGERGDLDRLGTDGKVHAAVRSVLDEIIALEGPVEQHRLARLTLNCFGLAKTSEERRATVLGLLDPALFQPHAVGVFVWPPHIVPDTWTSFRRNAGGDRAFEEIAPEEIANAARHALDADPSRSEDQLLRPTLELLGFRRMTEKIERLLRHGIVVGRATKRL